MGDVALSIWDREIVGDGGEIVLTADPQQSVQLGEGTALFTADFGRDGPDLILTQENGATIQIIDYFKLPEPADIISPEGAVLRGDVVEVLAGPQAPGQYVQAGPTQGASAIGQVETLQGAAFVQRSDGTSEQLDIGTKVFQNDVVSTADGSTVSLTFVDGTIFSLSSGSRMILSELIYDPQGSQNSGVFDLVEGGFVFIAGQVAKTGGIDVNTPTATMGIRGTTILIEIETVNGVTTVEVALNPDPDGTIGAFTITDLEGNLIANVTSTATKWVISPVVGETREIVRSAEDLAADQPALDLVQQAFQNANNRINNGENFVEQNASGPDDTDQQDDDSGEEGQDDEGNPGEDGFDEDPDRRGNLDGEDIETELASTNRQDDSSSSLSTSSLPDGSSSGFLTETGSLGDGEIGGSSGGQTFAQGSSTTSQSSSTVSSSGEDQPFEQGFEVGDTPQEPDDPLGLIITLPVLSTNVQEDGAIIISGFVIDGPEDVILTATLSAEATVTLAPGSGVTIISGTGVEDDEVVIQGTIEQITNALNGAGAQDGLIFTPSPNADDVGTLTIMISDGVNSITSTLEIGIDPVQDAPEAGEDQIAGNSADGVITSNVLTNDIDPDITPVPDVLSVVSAQQTTLSIPIGTEVTLSGGGSFVLNADGSFSFDPGDAYDDLGDGESAIEVVTYTIDDGNGNVDTATLTITILGANDGPVAQVFSTSGVEDGSIAGQLIANDIDGDPLTFAALTNPANGSLIVNEDGSFTYTPDANFNGTDSFTFEVQDAIGAIDTQTVTLTIDAVNDAPAVDPGLLTNGIFADIDTPASIFGISVSDIDAENTEVQVELSVGQGTLNISTFIPGGLTAGNITNNNTNSVLLVGTIAAINATLASATYVPNTGFSGTDTLQVTVNDLGNNGSGGALTALQPINISVGGDTIIGTDVGETLVGGDASDVIFGLGGNDNLFGGLGNDVLLGGDGDFDVIFADEGDDILDGGDDFLGQTNQRGLFDHVDFTNSLSAVSINLAEGFALDGFGGNDRVQNIEGVFSTSFNDIVIGGNPGNDIFEIFRSSPGDDLFDGGSGFDRVRYREDPDAVIVNLSRFDQTVDSFNFGETTLANVIVAAGTARDGFGNTDTLFNIESVQGSNFDDFLFGNDEDNQFRPQDGIDFVDGAGGIDQINFAFTGGFQGVVVDLAAQTATDTFGNIDQILNFENVIGSQFSDTISGDSGENTFFLDEGGSDTFDGRDGVDTIVADFSNLVFTSTVISSNFRFNLSTQNATINGIDTAAQTAFDTLGNIHSVFNIENVTGSDENDFIIGSEADNILLGNDGDTDVIAGLGGNDFIDGGGDFDFQAGARGVFDHVDFSNAPAGVAVNLSAQQVTANGLIIAAQSAQDGSGGTDTVINIEGVFGSDFDDTLIGGNIDNDSFEIFRSSPGDDFIDGGTGFDRIRFREDPAAVTVNLSATTQGGVNPGQAIDGFGDLDTLVNINSVQGSNFDDFLFGGAGDEQFRPQGGDDFIDGGDGSDEIDFSFTGGSQGVTIDLSQGSANDTFGNTDSFIGIENVRGSQFDDFITGNAEDNRFRISEGGNDTFDGGAGNDTIVFDSQNLAGGGIQFETIDLTATVGGILFDGVFVDLVEGIANDNVFGNHTLLNIENVTGSIRGDTLIGNEFDNQLIGGDGDDFLEGGGGNDFFDGGDDFDLGVGGRSNFDHITFNSANTGIAVNFSNQQVTANGLVIAAQTAQDGQNGVDTVINVEGIIGTQFDDTLIGGNTDNDDFEIFRPRDGNDFIDGGSGFDRVRYTEDDGAFTTTGIIVNVSGTIVTARDVDVLSGTVYDGAGGVDTIISIESFQGTNEIDFFIGSEGNEQFRGLSGDDFIDGGGGIDEADYAFSINNPDGQGVVADLALGIATDDFGFIDVLLNIENLRGSHFNDVLLGDEGANGFRVSTGGNDIFDGRGGIDTLEFTYEVLSGVGLVFENGVVVNLENEAALGADGAAHIIRNIENVDGSNLDDRLRGNSADNVLDGREGDDDIFFGEGNDQLFGGSGQDTLFFEDSGSVDLTAISNEIFDSFEAISLNDNIASNLTLAIDDVLTLSDANNTTLEDLLGTALENSLIIDADAGDAITLEQSGSDVWVLNTEQSAQADGFDVYNVLQGGSNEVLATVGIDDQAAVSVVTA